ncbi:COP9 signalosome subunit 7 (CsnG) [Paramyrothecium foliicola]|nr:COP9 signalosome subunit 7 (CsnG) [Paramyrothecium foliicola]
MYTLWHDTASFYYSLEVYTSPFLFNSCSRRSQLHGRGPFLALSKSATSPRAAADLVTRATSAPNTYVFTELLQTPSIQSLAGSQDFLPYLNLLQIFSYGTYQTYKQANNLPDLTDSQTLKLRQLSLLSLARERTNLSYDALQGALDLSSARQLEDLVISAVYAGLLHATLDPARQCVQVFSVSPLRDLSPGSIPDMITSLKNWASRCGSTLADIETQVNGIRAAAAARASQQRASDDKLKTLLVTEAHEMEKKQETSGSQRDVLSRRLYQKRAMGEAAGAPNDESMDLDDHHGVEDALKRASKRKM